MYTREQIAFTLAWLAYRGDPLPFGAALNAKLVLEMFKAKIRDLPPLGDEWDVAWGPALHQFPFALVNDGMMVVARNKQEPRRLVIAIRGTNPASLSTWLFQNLRVADTVPWPFGAPPPALRPVISEGTSRGLTTLLEAVPATGVPGEGVRLLDFLRSEVASHGAADITLTGHSLGGVLASTLALALADLRTNGAGIAAAWDPGEQANLTTYSFAAPTAGNRDFATYTDQRIGPTLHRLWNTHDVVPHAWDTKMLDRVPMLYAPDVPPDPFMELFRLVMTMNVAKIGYAHPEMGEREFTGAIDPTWPLFGPQAIHQHGQAYLDFMGLSHFLSVLDVVAVWKAVRAETSAYLKNAAFGVS